METRKWSDLSHEALDISEVEKLYLPRDHYTVRKSRYLAGARFVGSLYDGADVFVVSGMVRYEQELEFAVVKAGECVSLRKGRYRAEVMSDERVELIFAFKLPEELVRSPSP